MDKQNDPERPLRAKVDAAHDDDDGRNVGDGESDGGGDDGAAWAGWTLLQPVGGNAAAAGVGRALRDQYNGVVEEPIPDLLKDLLTRLG